MKREQRGEETDGDACLAKLPVTTKSANNPEDVHFPFGYELTQTLANGNKTARPSNSGTTVHNNRPRTESTVDATMVEKRKRN